MSDNVMVCIIVVAIIGSCTAGDIADKIILSKRNPVESCVAKAWTQADRIQCLQQGAANK